jgi:acyl-coenzyme A synthetase/AMP-(fatty) acid ligase
LSVFQAVIQGIEAGCSVLFADEKYSDAEVKHALENLQGINELNAAAFLTSGTTGPPRLVVHSFESLVRSSVNLARTLGLKEPRIHHLFPPNYMAGVLNCMILPWANDGVVCLDRTFGFQTTVDLARNVEKLDSNMAWMSPRMITAVGRRSQSNEPFRKGLSLNWNLVLSATSRLDQKSRDSLVASTGIRVLNTYGTTEHTFIASEVAMREEVTCGALLPSQEISGLEQLENGSFQGSLWVGSPYTAKHVLGESGPEVPFQGRGRWPVRPTGDNVAYDGEFLRVLGRNDDVLVVDGVNVPACAYEDLLRGCRGVVDAACLLLAIDGHDRLVVAVEWDQDGDASEFVRTCWAAFDDPTWRYVTPARLAVVSQLPRTSSGKVQKRLIAESAAVWRGRHR